MWIVTRHDIHRGEVCGCWADALCSHDMTWMDEANGPECHHEVTSEAFDSAADALREAMAEYDEPVRLIRRRNMAGRTYELIGVADDGRPLTDNHHALASDRRVIWKIQSLDRVPRVKRVRTAVAVPA